MYNIQSCHLCKLSLIVLLWVPVICAAQFDNSGFYGTHNQAEEDICQMAKGFSTDTDVKTLITRMVEKLGLKNRFEIKSCSTIDNCQAAMHNGRPYILYNNGFLESVKTLNFTETQLQRVEKENWEVLTVLAHELGHHYDFHLNNPHPDKTPADLELEADEFAGKMMCSLGATLEQAQKVYLRSSVSDEGSYTHPARSARLAAIARGWSKEDCGEGKLLREYIDEDEFYELGSPVISTCEMIEINDEFDCGKEGNITVNESSSIYNQIGLETAFQIKYSNIKNADYHYLIEQERQSFRHYKVPLSKSITLPNEEFHFSKKSDKPEKLVVLLSTSSIKKEVLDKLCSSASHFTDDDALLGFFEKNLKENYYAGSILPLIFNIGE